MDQTSIKIITGASMSEPNLMEPMKITDEISTYYQVFRDVSRSVHSSTNLKAVLELVVVKVTQVLSAKGALLRIHNDESAEFEVAASHGMNERYLVKGPISVDRILEESGPFNQLHVINDIFRAPRVQYPQETWDEGIRQILDVPLRAQYRMVGLLRIYLSEQRLFSNQQKEFLISLAEQCACAISNAKLYEKQKSEYNHLALHTEKLSSLGRMAAGIAHEINNPLGGILLYGTNIIKKIPPNEPAHHGLEVIIRETKRCKGIIQKLLEFSRDNKPDKRLTDLNQVIQRALEILDNEFRLRHITVFKDLCDEEFPLLLDHDQMVQVFVNLFLNANQAIDDVNGGWIKVESRLNPCGDQIKISVEDNGCGIEPEQINRLFEPFYSTKSTGTGLGLSVTYGIVQNHGGSIQVNSNPGKGTRITLSLPLRQVEARPIAVE